MAAKGGVPAGITVGDCVELLDTVAAVRAGQDAHAHSPLFYQLLRAWGAFGQDAPAATARCSPAAGSRPASS